MEAPQVSSGTSKPSFAKVVASTATKENTPPTARRVPAPPQGQTGASASTSASPAVPPNEPRLTVANGSSAMPAATDPGGKDQPEPPKIESADPVVDGLKDLHLGTGTPSLVVNGSGSNITDRSKSANRDGSDESQRADSNSELGTKPPSLDGKSITSGTTFALDEKESLRPDDSASVKASATEDDDSFSFRGPVMPNSRMGSDLAARARGIQLGDMPERRIPQPTPGSQSQGVATPQSASSDHQNVPSNKPNMAKITDLSNYMNALHGQTPDEKLLDAMSSQKDRLFLLRLEAELIKFVQNSKMLTHKLADYYHMTHQYEPRIGTVRIFRTPYARVPESLASMTVTEPKNESPAPVLLPRKIMRRGEDGEPSTGSGTPSKATSESGNDTKDKAPPAAQKPTREEREEAYKQARERIFGSSDKTGESTPDQEGENGMSRTSSVSAKDKANGAKRNKANKQRRDDSDSLDSRHLYGPFGPQQSWVPQPQYPPVANSQYSMPMQQQSYGGQMQPMYPQTGQPYTPQMHPSYSQYPPNMPAYPPQGQPVPSPVQPNQRPQPQMASSPNLGAYGAPVPAPQPTWQQGYNPAANAGPAPAPGSAPMAGPTPHATSFTPRGTPAQPAQQPTVPYAYGQLPAHINPHDPKSQHPIPGSYNRHAFNPKTQSFVPGGGSGMGPLPPQPHAQFNAPGPHGSPQIGTPHLAYNAYQQPGHPGAYGAPSAYSMARQGSNSSVPPYQAPPPQHPQHMGSIPGGYVPQQQPPPPHGHSQNATGHIPNKPAAPQGPAGQTLSHLPQYGNPATLPQRPNTGV